MIRSYWAAEWNRRPRDACSAERRALTRIAFKAMRSGPSIQSREQFASSSD